MLITKQMLIEHNACAEGIEDFETHYPDGFDTDTLTKDVWIDLATGPMREWLGWGVRRGLLPRIDLSGADLREARLSRADLYRANLSGAKLVRAELIEADLLGAVLCGAVLHDAYLSGADLTSANLFEADLSGANLHEADWTWTNLYGAKYNRKTIWPEGFDPVAAGCVLVED